MGPRIVSIQSFCSRVRRGTNLVEEIAWDRRSSFVHMQFVPVAGTGLFRPLVPAVSTCGHTPSFHRRIVLTITASFPVSIGDETAGCAPAHFPEERHEAQTIHTSPFRRSHLRSKEAP